MIFLTGLDCLQLSFYCCSKFFLLFEDFVQPLKPTTLILLAFAIPVILQAQTIPFADSLRKAYEIPELAYAVVSSTQVLKLQVLGTRKANENLPARLDDRFRIGSNTKTITGFLAALLVKEKKIAWNTAFFDLFPELKQKSHSDYHNLTLKNLLSFRTHLIPYTYTNERPAIGQFAGNDESQRYQFMAWVLQQKPHENKDSIVFCNPAYCAAGMMLEKASGKSYLELIQQLGDSLGVRFYVGAPNATDSSQPWGHDSDLKPEPPAENQKLNWLLPAGNISMSLPDFATFIQHQLLGLAGKSTLLTREEFYFLHFGLERFSIGWFQAEDENNQLFSWHLGNPGTFLSKVQVYPKMDRAMLILTNVQSPLAQKGIDILMEKLKGQFVD